MSPFSSGRNFGFGKQIEYAGKNALRSLYGDGHYSTVAGHTQRWRVFCTWAREQGVTDLSKIDSVDIAVAYAHHISMLIDGSNPEQQLAVSTGQNRISSVNTVFHALRGDRYVTISPRRYAGRRCNVRQHAPSSIDYERVEAAAQETLKAGFPRAAIVLILARTLGVRREEAVKGDLDRWYREANRIGKINILDGTKGGRRAERWVKVGNRQQSALEFALANRPAGSKNLIAIDETYAALAIDRRGEINLARAVLHLHGLRGYHDARAAYACQRYREITGFDAPAVSGLPPENRVVDLRAREIIAVELGHGRIDVTVSYVGGRR